MTDEDADLSLPAAHPAFSAHFTDDIYEDRGDELAPLGSDEGAGVLAQWAERRSDLSASSTVRGLLEADVKDVDEFMDEAANLVPISSPRSSGQDSRCFGFRAASTTKAADGPWKRSSGHGRNTRIRHRLGCSRT